MEDGGKNSVISNTYARDPNQGILYAMKQGNQFFNNDLPNDRSANLAINFHFISSLNISKMLVWYSGKMIPNCPPSPLPAFPFTITQG